MRSPILSIFVTCFLLALIVGCQKGKDEIPDLSPCSIIQANNYSYSCYLAASVPAADWNSNTDSLITIVTTEYPDEWYRTRPVFNPSNPNEFMYFESDAPIHLHQELRKFHMCCEESELVLPDYFGQRPDWGANGNILLANNNMYGIKRPQEETIEWKYRPWGTDWLFHPVLNDEGDRIILYSDVSDAYIIVDDHFKSVDSLYLGIEHSVSWNGDKLIYYGYKNYGSTEELGLYLYDFITGTSSQVVDFQEISQQYTILGIPSHYDEVHNALLYNWGGRIIRVDLDSGIQDTILGNQPGQGQFGKFSVAPDGSRVIAERWLNEYGPYVKRRYGRLVIVDMYGNNMRRIFIPDQ